MHSPELPHWLKSSYVEKNSVTVPPYNPIKVGTQVGINYAAYHLPAWCYFRNSWSALEEQEDKASDKIDPKSVIGMLKHVKHDKKEETVNGMGQGNMFLSRSHEFQGQEGENEYKYRLYKDEEAHHVDTWAKFASDDNEELLPPTMKEEWFKELKKEFFELVEKYEKQDEVRALLEFKAELPVIDRILELPEYEFDELFRELESSLPFEEVENFLTKMSTRRREQEQILIQETHRRIEEILKPDPLNFKSVLERKVEHDKEVDRVVRSLFAHKMRLDVRVNEIENIETYLGLRDKGCNNLSDILESLRKKVKVDLEKKDLEKKDLEKIKKDLEKIDDKDNEDIVNEINELEKFFLKTEPGQTPTPSDFRKSINELKDDRYKYFQKRQTEFQESIFKQHKTGEVEIKWDQLKDKIMGYTAENKRQCVEDYLDFLREIDIMEFQALETDLASIKKGVDEVMRRVKRVANEIEQRVEKLLKEEKGAKPTPLKILSFKPKHLESPFSVDDLNIYLRYPPIKNRLVYHEGNWPPLRAVPSETTVSVQRMEGGMKEYQNITLSNVIGRFDEAFTLFSSTLADHGMPRPTPQPRPIRFRYGMGEVVPALDHATKGISDMKLGEIRIMVCPSRTCYGERGVPDSVPPHMPLVYVVRMNGIYSREDENYESDDEIPSDQSGSQDEDSTI